jgi:hypothetical protein
MQKATVFTLFNMGKVKRKVDSHTTVKMNLKHWNEMFCYLAICGIKS